MANIWIPPITYGDLVGMAESFSMQFPSVRPSPEAMQFAMAATVLRALVGDEWCDENLVGAEKADPYLVTNSTKPADRMKIQARIAALGELVYNLQRVYGAQDRFARIQRSSLEIAISDLEAARLLSLSERTFRFVEEQQLKGFDYDIEVTFKPHLTLCCESKCKVETTELSHRTIFNSLRKAASQLPAKEPGAIFVKIPEPWISTPAATSKISVALDEFYKKSGRTAEVIFHWEEWQPLESGGLLRLAKFREEINRQSRFFDSQLFPFLRPWSPIWNPPSWTRFTDAIKSARGGAR